MMETIELRTYLKLLLARWQTISIATALFIGVATLIYVFTPSNYAAVSLVAITSPQQTIALNPDLLVPSAQEPAPPYRAYPEIALSDTVLFPLLQRAQTFGNKIETLDDLHKHVRAQTGDDQSLVRLVVEHPLPEAAADLTNFWAETFVVHTNQLLGTEDAARQATYSAEFEQSNANWAAANAAFISFQTEQSESILRQQLSSLEATLGAYLTDLRVTTLAIQDIGALITQIEAIDPDEQVSLSDEITALNLQLKAFDATSEMPLEISAGVIEPRSSAEMVRALRQIITSLETKSAGVTAQVDTIKPEILSAQAALETYLARKAELAQAVHVAEETSLLLARRVEEEGIRATTVDDTVKLISVAQPPTEPAQSLLLTLAVAGMMGAMLATLTVLTMAWWRGPT